MYYIAKYLHEEALQHSIIEKQKNNHLPKLSSSTSSIFPPHHVFDSSVRPNKIVSKSVTKAINKARYCKRVVIPSPANRTGSVYGGLFSGAESE